MTHHLQQPQSFGQQSQQPQYEQQNQQPQYEQQYQQYGQQSGALVGGQQQQTQFPQQRQSQMQYSAPAMEKYEKTMPSEFRVALHDFNMVAEVAEWCRNALIDQGVQRGNVVRTLEDLADIAAVNEQLIVRDSEAGAEVVQAFLKVAQHAVTELQQDQHPVVEETVPVVQRAVESATKLLTSLDRQQQFGQQQQFSQQSQSGQQQQFTQQKPRFGQRSIGQQSIGQQGTGQQSIGQQF